MKILLLGSNGMVGSSIARVLRNSDKELEVILSSRKDTDLFSFEQTQKLIIQTKPDVLIIAAAKVGGILYNNTNRSEFILENLKINMNIFESCIPFPNIKIINLGSSCIYPVHASNPINEEAFMTGKLEETNSPYAMAKISAIEIGRSISTQYGHRVLNLMPTNLYGPNDFFHPTKGHVIPSLMTRMLQAKIKKDDEFLIWGTGTPKREFLYVDDLAECIEFLLEKDTEDDILNVGSNEEITINKLAEKIKYTISFEGKLNFDNSKPDGNPRKLLDSSKINKIGWKSKTSLTDGLTKTYSWFLENQDNIRN